MFIEANLTAEHYHYSSKIDPLKISVLVPQTVVKLCSFNFDIFLTRMKRNEKKLSQLSRGSNEQKKTWRFLISTVEDSVGLDLKKETLLFYRLDISRLSFHKYKPI